MEWGPLVSWTMEFPSGFHDDSRDQRNVENAAVPEQTLEAWDTVLLVSLGLGS